MIDSLPFTAIPRITFGITSLVLCGLAALAFVFSQRWLLQQRQTMAIADSNQQIRALLRDLRLGVVVTNAQFRVRMCNQAALVMLGLTEPQIQGDEPLPSGWSAYFENGLSFETTISSLLSAIADLADQVPEQNIVVGVHKNTAESIWVLINAVPQRTTTGSLDQVIYTFSDITERKQAEIELIQQAERDRLVSTIAQRIRQSLDLTQILNTAVAEVRQQLKADRVVVCHISEAKATDQTGDHSSRQDIEVVAESLERQFSPTVGTRIHQVISSERRDFYQTGQPYVVHDAEAAELPSYLKSAIEYYHLRAFIVAPILQGDHLWGLLIAHQAHQPRHWTLPEIEFLCQLATQVAIAIQQSQLYQQVQQFNTCLESQVAERTDQLAQALEFEATLKRITDKVRDSLDENQILQTAVKELGLVLEAHSCNAALYDLNREVSAVRYEYTVSTVAYQGRVMQMANRPELYHQLRRGYYFQFCSLSPNSPRGPAVMLASPIVDNEGVIGDLWVVDEQSIGFSESQIRLVQQVTNQCAIAIRQARLYQASKNQIQELERLNRLKDDFLSTVSHELRTPMSNMKMAIHMLKSIPNSQKRQQYLEILEAECSREVELINDLLDLQRLEAASYPANTEDIRLQVWLPSIIEPFYDRATEYQQTLQFDCSDDLPLLSSDTIALRRVLTELLNNACKYTSAEGKILLQVSTTLSSIDLTPEIVFCIQNQAEIPPTELPYIFEKFYRVPNGDPWSRGGTGLGLALVKKLVERLKGHIAVESETGWTTFTVRFPMTMTSEELPYQSTPSLN